MLRLAREMRALKPHTIVIATNSLSTDLQCETLIADVAEGPRKRVVFVASADHAHAHRRSGPYGFSPAAAKYDALIVKAIRDDNLRSVLRISPKLVRAAKPDSLWQVTMLAGVAERSRMRPELYSYEVPAYYGMICAAVRK